MHHTLLLSKNKTSSRYALLNEKNMPVEFGVDYPTYKNAIYVARALDIKPNFGMVFFDLAPHFSRPGLFSTNPAQTKKFQIGQSYLVQISFAPSFFPGIHTSLKSKGPKITPEIRFSCPYFIYFPYTPGIFYSKHLEKKKVSSFLPALKALLSPQEGLILRPFCKQASLTSLQKYLKDIKTTAQSCLDKNTPSGTCVYTPPSSFFQKLESIGYMLSRILVDDKALFKEVDYFIKKYSFCCSVEFRIKNSLQESLFESFSLEEQWEESFSSFVPLPSGGNLIIEKTEGFWAVDINSQGREGISSALTPKALNEEAAKILFHTIRLRNLGGKIVVDFLPLSQKEDFQSFSSFLKRQVLIDPISLKISSLSPNGLCEITREKLDLSLEESMQLF